VTGTLELLGAFQLRFTSCVAAVTPVPVRVTTTDEVIEEVSVPEMAICPAAVPALDGSNATLSVTPWPGLRLTGKFTPDTLNPGPVIVAELIVRGRLSADVSVRGIVATLFTATFPKERLLVLELRMGVEGTKFNVKVWAVQFATAINVAC
jgi:hypothetical protein